MSKTIDESKLEIASKAVETARSAANSWQGKLLVLQTLGGVIVAIVKKGDTLHVIPAVVIVMYAMASLIIFMATLHLKIAFYWEDVIDTLTGGQEFRHHQAVVGEMVRGKTVLLSVIPTILISTVLVGISGYEALYQIDDTHERTAVVVLLVAAVTVFVANLVASARAEGFRAMRRSA